MYAILGLNKLLLSISEKLNLLLYNNLEILTISIFSFLIRLIKYNGSLMEMIFHGLFMCKVSRLFFRGKG